MKRKDEFTHWYDKYFHRLSEIFSVDITLEQTKNLISQCANRAIMIEREHTNTFCHEKALFHVLLELAKKAIFPHEDPEEVSEAEKNWQSPFEEDGDLSYEEVFGPYDRAHYLRMCKIAQSPVTPEIVEEMVSICRKRYQKSKGKKPITAAHEKTCAHVLSQLVKIAVFPQNGESFSPEEFRRYGFESRKMEADAFFGVCHYPDEEKNIFHETEASGAGDRYKSGMGWGNLFSIRYLIPPEDARGSGAGLAMGYGISNCIGGSYSGEPQPKNYMENISGFGSPSYNSGNSILEINGYPFVTIGQNCFLISQTTRDAANGFLFGYREKFLTPCRIQRKESSFSYQVILEGKEGPVWNGIENTWIF